MIIVKCDGQARGNPYVVHLRGGVAARFERGMLNGRHVLFARVADTHPGCAAARAQIEARTDGKFQVFDGDETEIEAAAVTTSRAATKLGLHPAAQAALANGWTALDLEGTGRNQDPSPAGGFSKRTGLTQAQMALCVPPADWDAQAARFYPWEIDGWKPPGQGFKVPQAPAKVQPEPEAKPEPELEAAPEPEPEPELEAAPEPEPELEAAPEPEPEAAPTNTAQALIAAGYDAEKVLDLLELVASVQGDGALPSQSKLNYRLKKNELPTITKAQHRALTAP